MLYTTGTGQRTHHNVQRQVNSTTSANEQTLKITRLPTDIYQTVKENEKHWEEAKCFMEETARNTEPIPEFDNLPTKNVEEFESFEKDLQSETTRKNLV